MLAESSWLLCTAQNSKPKLNKLGHKLCIRLMGCALKNYLYRNQLDGMLIGCPSNVVLYVMIWHKG